MERGKLVRLAGVEPATCGFEVRRSIHLSYRRFLHQKNCPLKLDKLLAFHYNA